MKAKDIDFEDKKQEVTITKETIEDLKNSSNDSIHSLQTVIPRPPYLG